MELEDEIRRQFDSPSGHSQTWMIKHSIQQMIANATERINRMESEQEVNATRLENLETRMLRLENEPFQVKVLETTSSSSSNKLLQDNAKETSPTFNDNDNITPQEVPILSKPNIKTDNKVLQNDNKLNEKISSEEIEHISNEAVIETSLTSAGKLLQHNANKLTQGIPQNQDDKDKRHWKVVGKLLRNKRNSRFNWKLNQANDHVSPCDTNAKIIIPKDWDSKEEIIRKLFLDSQTKINFRTSQYFVLYDQKLTKKEPPKDDEKMKITYWPTKKQQQQKEISTKTPSNLNIISLSNPNMKFITPKDWDSKTEIIRKLFLDSQTKLHINISREHNSPSPNSILMKSTKRTQPIDNKMTTPAIFTKEMKSTKQTQPKDNKMTTPAILTKEMNSHNENIPKASDKEAYFDKAYPNKTTNTKTHKDDTPVIDNNPTRQIFIY